jgi:hypothetical protein
MGPRSGEHESGGIGGRLTKPAMIGIAQRGGES